MAERLRPNGPKKRGLERTEISPLTPAPSPLLRVSSGIIIMPIAMLIQRYVNAMYVRSASSRILMMLQK